MDGGDRNEEIAWSGERNEFSTLGAAETRPEMRPMTLDYASPEQVRGDPITTATDVYSLGVLLYRLLTGRLSYGPQVQSFVALQHAVCEIDPIKPSAVILTDEKTVIPQATQAIEIGEESRTKARARLRRAAPRAARRAAFARPRLRAPEPVSAGTARGPDPRQRPACGSAAARARRALHH